MRGNTEGLGDNSFFAGCLVCYLSSLLWGWGGFSTDGAVWSPSTYLLCFSLGWLVHHCMGNGCYSGWSLFFCLFHLNICGSFHWGNWSRCPSIKKVCGSWHGIRPWRVLPFLWGCGRDCSFGLLLQKGLLPLGVEGPLLLGAFL